MVRAGTAGGHDCGDGDVNRGFMAAWWRSFFIQACFNYDRMIGIGIGYAMAPMVRYLGRDVARRAAGFFNANPYLAPMAVGAIARAECDQVGEEPVVGLRNALVAALGSVGDRLTWAGVMPAAVGVGLIVGVSISPLAGAIVFLTLYNIVLIPLRWWALRAGWREGLHVAQALNARRIQRSLRVVGPFGAMALGIAIPLVADWLLEDLARAETIGAGAIAAAAIVLGRWVMPSLGGLRFGLIAAGLALIGGSLWP